MHTYLILKWLHIVSSVLMVGTGLGSAFYLFFANRSGSLEAQAVVSRLVVRADWWFTTPTVIIQPATGFDGLDRGLAARYAVAAVESGALCRGRGLLVAGGVAADSHGRDGGPGAG